MVISRHLQGHAAMLGFAALISGSFSLGGYAARLVDPAALMALRFLLAGLLIGAVAALGPRIKKRDLRAPWRYLVLGGVYAIYFVLMFEGLKTADPVSTSAVFTLTPFMSAGFGWILLRQVMTKRMATALTIGVLGALWVIFDADMAALLSLDLGYGEFLFFLGCFAHALYTPMTRKFNWGEPPLVMTFGTLVGGFFVLSVFSAPEIIRTDWAALPVYLWLIMAYLVVFATAATFFMLQYASLRIPSAKVMAYTYLTPAFVILWEGALGHGWPGAAIFAGMALIALALYLLLKE